MAPVPMTPDDYVAAIEVLELAGEALAAKAHPEQRHVEALMCLRATVESCKPVDGANELQIASSFRVDCGDSIVDVHEIGE